MDVYAIPSLLLELSTVMTLLPFFALDQSFSVRGDFLPQETFGNVWRHFW